MQHNSGSGCCRGRGRCGSLENCVALSFEQQRCECVFGYHRDEAAACAWDGLLDDPEFAYGCAGWRLTVHEGNPDHEAAADIADGELRLSVSHRCSGATATTDARLPAPETVPRAALLFSAKGSVGALLGVSFDGDTGLGDPTPEHGILAATGNGEWQEYMVCLDPRRPMRPAVVQFGVGQFGLCQERIDHRFSVRSVSIASDPSCE